MRVKVYVKGVVQGVGFRPFVYKLATNLGLVGYVLNSGEGVEIEIEGQQKSIDKFLYEVKNNPPILSKITQFKTTKIDKKYETEFTIFHSTKSSKTTLISADIKTCKDCLLDIEDKNSRFYNYFATNCTNCGPRYSIIKTVPYDRSNTSMSNFKMCKECEKEYKNPLSRRYHAQPISCKNCGPKLSLYIGKKIIEDNIYDYAANLIDIGKIGAIKGIGGFHIVCDANNIDVVCRLREYKRQPRKPFAIMCKDIEQIKSFAKVSKKEEELLLSKEAPIVILDEFKKINLNLNPNISKIGCFLPYTPLHYLLFKYLNNPIVATSANLSGEPIITNRDEIIEKLSFIDFIIDYNRDIVNPIDDSVVQVVNDDIMILRLARGYAPKSINVSFKVKDNILAFGANQKSTIAIYLDENITISPYIANLNSVKSLDYYNKTIDTFKRFYDFKADILVCDKHPNYESTKVAQSLKSKNLQLKLNKTTHHMAHLYSVKAEFNLNSKDFVAFIFDGTGLGDDNTLWGGEIFVRELRKYYFKPIKLIGGEKAIKEPFRVALSMLFEKYSVDDIKNKFNYNSIDLLYKVWSKDINSPLSSSVGRMFDAVASISNLCNLQTYEGEAGILCEMAYNSLCRDSFKFNIDNSQISIEFDFLDKNLVSKFINTLVEIIIFIAKKENFPVLLSGGVFQNKILLELLINRFKKENIRYFYNKTIPINDSGISIGQVYKELMS